MDNLVSLLKAVGPASVNPEVRARILELIQSWATATEGRYDLAYIGEVYKTLQREGFKFPPRVTVASSMIDSSAVSGVFGRRAGNQLTSNLLATRMGRFRRLYEMPDRLHLHKPEASLSQLRQLF